MPEQRIKLNTIRLSMGTEHIEDMLEDLAQADGTVGKQTGYR